MPRKPKLLGALDQELNSAMRYRQAIKDPLVQPNKQKVEVRRRIEEIHDERRLRKELE